MLRFHASIVLVYFLIISSGVRSQITIYSENFNAGIGSWSSVDESDATDQWTATTGYMEINGFGGSNDVDWLISPSINLDAQTNEYFMFDYFDNFSGNLIELYYSTDYNGGGTLADVSSAVWTSISISVIDFDATSCSSSAFQRHPAIDISTINGASVYFAFYYTGLAASSKNYRIDDVHIDADYYGGITNTECASLKSELRNLIRTQDVIRYTSSLYDVWDAILHTDTRQNDAGTATIVWDMFTDIPAATGEFEFNHCANRDGGSCAAGEGVCYNREHTFPRSWWGGGTTLADTQNTDMHHIYASDRLMNTLKSNYPPGIVTAPSNTGSNGYMVGANPAHPCVSTSYFEPIDEYKGDYARTFFYFVTRYEHNMVAWAPINARGDCFLDASTYPSIDPWGLALMLQWHAADPVGQKEIDHNNAVYAIQGNRNPYIDNPNWVNFVWGDELGAPCNLIALPVELISFTALPEMEHIKLKWLTASEQSSDYFLVERSENLIDWNEVTKLNAAGYSNQNITYDAVDFSPIQGKSYYRIKQVDYDGSTYLSRVESVLYSTSNEIQFYPNPFGITLTISGVSSLEEIRFISVAGQDCSKLIEVTSKNNNALEINTSRLKSGLYLLHTPTSLHKVVRK